MKKAFALLFFAALLSQQFAAACTTFFIEKNGQKVFGKNYDWQTATGVVHTNLRGHTKTSLPFEGGKSFQWTSKYGSVTFNQYGKEFPNGGMNEKGLVVELMWLDGSEFPKPDERPSISVLQWIQYQLDNCSTVADVIATDKVVRIVSAGTPQHYLVADASGNTATVEFLQGKMVVHTGKELPYPVLANDKYATSVKNYSADGKGRFNTACNMVQQYQTAGSRLPLVDYSFNILQQVAQGDYTKWSIVYDISNKAIFFKTLNNTAVKRIAMDQFKFEPSATALSFNMNQPMSGDVSKKFVAFAHDENKRMLQQAFKECANQITVPAELQQAMAMIAANASSK